MYIDLNNYEIIIKSQLLQIKINEWKSLAMASPKIITKEVINTCFYKSIFYHMSYYKISKVCYINKFELEFPRF